MVYVYVDSLRMAYVQNILDATTLSDPNDIKEGDTIIFPVLDKNQRILPLKKGNLKLATLEGCKLFLPFPYSFFKENNEVHYYMRDEQLIKNNATLTAMGLISYLGSLDISLKDSHFDVIGYGKCGEAIIAVLKAMNLSYSIIRHQEVDKSDINMYTIDEYRKIDKGNVIINTAPYNLLLKDDFSNCHTSYIIDISSEKCFKNEELPENINLIYPGSLPNKYFAYSSATLIADFVKGR